MINVIAAKLMLGNGQSSAPHDIHSAIAGVLSTGVRPDKEHIPLVWFDYVMRRAGPALPLPALVLRWCACRCLESPSLSG